MLLFSKLCSCFSDFCCRLCYCLDKHFDSSELVKLQRNLHAVTYFCINHTMYIHVSLLGYIICLITFPKLKIKCSFFPCPPPWEQLPYGGLDRLGSQIFVKLNCQVIQWVVNRVGSIPLLCGQQSQPCCSISFLRKPP